MIGTKKKNGKTVPNCVPIKSPSSRMPHHLELGSDGHSFGGKAIVVNSQTGKHYSLAPIPLEKAKKQMRLLNAVEHGFKPTGKKS